jgi:hypothetical protein
MAACGALHVAKRIWGLHARRKLVFGAGMQVTAAAAGLLSLLPAAHLRTGDNIVLLRQDIHQLPLALIAPLCTKHDADLRREALRRLL